MFFCNWLGKQQRGSNSQRRPHSSHGTPKGVRNLRTCGNYKHCAPTECGLTLRQPLQYFFLSRASCAANDVNEVFLK